MAPAATGPLSPSQEEAYRIKCMELIARMKELSTENDQLRLRKARLVRGIKKMRLERAFLLDAIKQRMPKDDIDAEEDEDTEDSSDSPPTPQERPLRTKKSHRRAAASPTPAGSSSRANAGGDTKGASAAPGPEGKEGKDGKEGKEKKKKESSAAPAAAAADDDDAVAPKADPDAPEREPKATSKASSKNASTEASPAFRAFSNHLLKDILPTDPHGEAEVKNDFNDDYDEYARKKWGELDATGRARWERETESKAGHSRSKKRAKSDAPAGADAEGDTEMKDAGD